MAHQTQSNHAHALDLGRGGESPLRLCDSSPAAMVKS